MRKLNIGDKVVTTKGYEGIITNIDLELTVTDSGNGIVIHCGEYFFTDYWVDWKKTNKANRIYVDISKSIQNENSLYKIHEFFGVISIEDKNTKQKLIDINSLHCTVSQIDKILKQFGFYCVDKKGG